MGLIDVVKQAQRSGAAATEGFVSLPPAWILHQESSEGQEQYRKDKEGACTPCPILRKCHVPSDDPIKLRVEEEEALAVALKEKADAPLHIYQELLTPYLEKLAGKTIPFYDLLRQTSPRLGRLLLGTVITIFCDHLCWDGVKNVLESDALSDSICPELVSVLVEHNQVYLLCLWLQHECDLRYQDLSLVLKEFLMCSKKSSRGLAAVRRYWRGRAISDLHNAESLKKRAAQNFEQMRSKAIMSAAAFDRFEPYELCIHDFVASGQDETVLGSIFSKLETADVIRLLIYLEKWLKKYSRPSVLCASHDRKAGKGIPSLPQILQWVSILMDTHFTTLILCTDFHAKLGSVQLLVNELVDEGHKCASLAGILEHIRSCGPLPSEGLMGSEGDHVIEYLEI